jgi:hypothetical protein
MVMRAVILVISVLVVGTILFFTVMGEGALKRHVTISGVYSVCRPDGYDVVCFLDADGKEGGMFCLPLAQVGGKCL